MTVTKRERQKESIIIATSSSLARLQPHRVTAQAKLMLLHATNDVEFLITELLCVCVCVRLSVKHRVVCQL